MLDKKEKEENKKENDDIQTFVPRQGNELDGIFNFLTDKTCGNIHNNRTINVTSNSICHKSYNPENLLSADKKSYSPKTWKSKYYIIQSSHVTMILVVPT